MPTAHFKLLQHPLRKTKGSVLLSTVKYTHPPQQHLCPAPELPTRHLQFINSRAAKLDNGILGEGWGSLQCQSHSPGTRVPPWHSVSEVEWCKPYPGHGSQTCQGGGSSDTAHRVCGFPVSVTCFMLVFSHIFFFLTSHKLQHSWQGNIYREPISQQFASTCLCLQSILHCFLCLENWLCYQRKLLATFCTIYLR